MRMRILTDHRRIQGIPVLECYNAEASGKLPLALILHGFTGNKEDHLVQGRQLAREGYYAVSADLHLHGELGDAPFMPARVAPRLGEVVERSVENLAILASAYEDSKMADAGRIGLMGISLGGAVIYHFLPRRTLNIKAAVCMIAGPSPIAHMTFKNIQRLFPDFGVTEELIATLSAASRSTPFLEGVRDFPLLMQYGKADPLIPIEEVRRLYREIKRGYTDPSMIELIEYDDTGHETPAGMYAQASRWFGKYLGTPQKDRGR